MFEVELKAVVVDAAERRKILEAAGAKLTFEGTMRDLRYDSEPRALAGRDEVLRVRRYESEGEVRTYLDWKGTTETRDVYKTREEVSTSVDDFAALATILEKLGFVVTREIDREIVQYELGGAMIRFETYPRMDVLVEVEGDPATIESAVEALGMARGEFTSERLPDFVSRFEKRTGVRAAICERELAGDYRFRTDDA